MIIGLYLRQAKKEITLGLERDSRRLGLHPHDRWDSTLQHGERLMKLDDRKEAWLGRDGGYNSEVAGCEVTDRKGDVDVNVRTGPNAKERNGTVVNTLQKCAGPEKEGAPTEDDNLNLGLKGMMAFKRVVWVQLYATSALEVVKRRESLLVDGVMVEVQIMEEWGYTLGEDACLVDEECEEKFANGMEEDDCLAFQKFSEENTHNQSTFSVNKDELVREVAPNQKPPSSEEDPPLDVVVICHKSLHKDCVRIQELDVPVLSTEGLAKQGRDDEIFLPAANSEKIVEPARIPIRSKRTMSCPPEVKHFVIGDLEFELVA
ncbi:hypothetical protein TSUD_349080 [Trifolium subterraneum]|uniref:DUF4283 domain-containing protein n=1 Tax=Trifolium subterraneum TaxID=3900 RepID=A0A2Z6N8Y8_TRISU|nr:hypothetical protein TSUD_349080 [Trifolium subterraneum]